LGAAGWASGLDPALLLLITLLGIAVQTRLLRRRYEAHALAAAE
jgi:hypothetical protein